MIVAKLKGARGRVRRAQGKCEGRKAYAEREGAQELVAMRGDCAAIQMAGLNPFAGSLPIWSSVVYVTPSGRPYASAIASMVGET